MCLLGCDCSVVMYFDHARSTLNLTTAGDVLCAYLYYPVSMRLTVILFGRHVIPLRKFHPHSSHRPLIFNRSLSTSFLFYYTR